MRDKFLIGVMLLSCCFAHQATGQPTPGFNSKIPEKIMTPDKVDTHFGTLDFVDGVPTEETTRKVYDHLDYIRGVEVFLNFIPATSIEGLRLGSHRTRRDEEQPGSHLRQIDGLRSAVPHGQYGHRVLHCLS